MLRSGYSHVGLLETYNAMVPMSIVTTNNPLGPAGDRDELYRLPDGSTTRHVEWRGVEHWRR